MTTAKVADKEELFQTTVYTIGQITYVPHYSKPGEFVGPGFVGPGYQLNPPKFPTHTADELLRMGATASKAYLWKRP